MQMNEARGFVMQALREGGWNQMTGLWGVAGNVKARSKGVNPNQHPSYAQFPYWKEWYHPTVTCSQ